MQIKQPHEKGQGLKHNLLHYLCMCVVVHRLYDKLYASIDKVQVMICKIRRKNLMDMIKRTFHKVLKVIKKFKPVHHGEIVEMN